MKLNLNIPKKRIIYILSPHYDDAILSCYTLIKKMSLTNKIIVINVFTNGHSGPYTYSAKKFLKSSGQYTDATKLYLDRKVEDLHVFSDLDVQTIDLGMTDAMFRKKITTVFLDKFIPELGHLYPTYRWHIIGNINKYDYAYDQLPIKLKRIISDKDFVIAPLALGNHVDHLITKMVCEGISENIIYYSDFPYNLKSNNKINTSNFTYCEVKPDKDKKLVLRKYNSQISNLFPNSVIPDHVEAYYQKI